MHSPPNLVLQRQLPGFPQDFNLVFHQGNLVPITWDVPVQYSAPAARAAPQQDGMSFGTFLAIGTTLLSVAVMLDPKSSKEAKSIAQTAMGVSLPFVLNQAFGFQAWPVQLN